MSKPRSLVQVVPTKPDLNSAIYHEPHPRRRFIIILTITWCIILILGGVVWYINSAIAHNAQLNNQTPEEQLNNYATTAIPLSGLPTILPLQSSATTQALLVNGQVEIANGLVLTPTPSQPATPQVGELYYDSVNNQPYYYDGTGFVTLKASAGKSGANGTNGLNGSNGAKGDKGDKGDTGAIGATGPSGASGNNIQNQNVTVQTADFLISGTGRAGILNASSQLQLGGININTTGALSNVAYLGQANIFTQDNTFSARVLTPQIDTANAGTLNIGTSNATGINLNQNTVVANNKSFTVHGAASFTDATNSTSAFEVQNASSINLLAVDTTNNGIIIGHDGVSQTAMTIRGGIATGTDATGANLIIAASNGTGTGGSGDLIFQTAAPAISTPTDDGNDNTGTVSSTTSLTFSHTVTSNANRILVVGIGTGCGFGGTCAGTVSSVTYAGISLTKLNSVDCSSGVGHCHIELWYLTNPATGTNSIVIGTSSSTNINAGASSYYNVDSTTPFGTSATGTGGGNPSTLNVSSNTSQVVVDIITSNNVVVAPSAGQVQHYNINTNGPIASSTKPGAAGTTNMGWSDGSSDYATIGAGLNPPSGTSSDSLQDRLHIAATGNVGIGTASPSATVDILQSNQTSGSPTAFKLTGGTNTSLTAANDPDLLLNLGRSVQFTGSVTNGAANFTNQHAIEINTPGYSFSNTGNQTIANAVGMYINNPPTANGAGNTTITNSIGLMIDNALNLGQGGTVTNGYGLYVNQPGSSGNSYGAYISSELVVGANKTPPAHQLVYLQQDPESGVNAQILHLSTNQYTTVPVSDNPDVVFDLGHNIQFAGSAVNGAANLASTNAFELLAPNYSYSNTGNQTIGSAATMYINSIPTSTAGNTSLTNAYGLLIDNATASGGAVNGYGLSVKAPTVGANNYAAIFQGGSVGVGTTTPKSVLDVNGNLALGTYAGVNAAPTNGLIVSGNVGIGTTSPGTAALAIQGGANDMVTITSTFNTGFIRPLEMLDSNMTAGNNLVYHVGHDLSNNDSGYFGFNYQGANSPNNFITMGLWGNDNIMNITGGGNVGIGDMGPSNKLKVVGSLCVKSTAGACAGNVSGTIYATNTTVQSADVAENYVSAQNLAPGDVIMPARDGNSQAIIKTTDTTARAIGVVSTQPGITLNSDAQINAQHPHLYPIALSGRVPVKVSTENGAIAAGDYLTVSSTPGVAMKATQAGETIGKALEDYASNDPHTVGTIMTFINLSWTDPSPQALSNNADPIGTLTSNPALFKATSDSTHAFQIQNTQGEALFTADTTNMKVTVTDLIVTGTLTVNGHIITGGTTPIITSNSSICTTADAQATIVGNDTSGTITILMGAGCTGSALKLAAIDFASHYSATPKVLLSPNNLASAHLLGFASDTSDTGFTLYTGAPVANGESYSWNYFVTQ